MQQTQTQNWHIFQGIQTAIIKSRKALAEELGDEATIVLGGRNYFYAKFYPGEPKIVGIIATTNVSVEHCDAPEYGTAYCGKLSAAVARHQYACHACNNIKKKNTAWSEKTLEDEIAKAAPHINPYDQGQEGQPDAPDAATMLTSFMDTATTHRDEHLAFAAKWDAYLTTFKDLHTDTQESLRLLEEAQEQLDKAQLRYNVTNFRVEKVLWPLPEHIDPSGTVEAELEALHQTGDDD
tara:strand:+ start:2612 stop:3322 length:711 start_codon:yes stop_codon:yes gene_type:complete